MVLRSLLVDEAEFGIFRNLLCTSGDYDAVNSAGSNSAKHCARGSEYSKYSTVKDVVEPRRSKEFASRRVGRGRK